MERILSGIGAIFRPIAKELIKGGIVVADAVSEFASETSEQIKDLLAEAKAEMDQSKNKAQESEKANRKEGQ